MPVGAPFNAALARVRELITRLHYEADRSALEEAARVRARELDADEYSARHIARPESPDRTPTPPEDAA